MHKKPLLPLLVLLSCATAQAQQAYPATLVGHAALPAQTFVAAPKDAPASLQTSGKYTTADGRREDRLGAIAGSSYLSAKDAPKPPASACRSRASQCRGFPASRP